MRLSVSWKIVLRITSLMVLLLRVSSTTFVGRRNNSKSLMRDSTKGLAWARFVKNEKRYLNLSEKQTISVSRLGQCALNCVKTFTSFSFNFGIRSNADGNYTCEILLSDRFNDSDKYKNSVDFHHYNIYSPCSDEPCQNGGTCIALYEKDEYRCVCPIGIKGKHCETVSASCSALKTDDPQTSSGKYVIDPDGEGGESPFTVYCDTTDKGGVGVTVVSHDSEARKHVSDPSYKKPGSYSRDVTYQGASLVQLAGLTRVSSNCEQFIKWECHNSDLIANRGVSGWWVSRDGNKMTYWGGATPGSGKCACGMTNLCAYSAQPCNCQGNDGMWRSDEGFLTDKGTLPVRQLRFGDIDGKSEEGYHTLGKFKCYGS